MTIEFPDNRKEITDRIKNDVQQELGKSNPFLRNSALASLIFGMAGRIFDFFSQLRFLLINMFPDTATGSFLERWGAYVKITRKVASAAEGFITIEGTIGSTIPNATAFQSTTQVQYSSSGAAVVIDSVRTINSLTRAAEIVTAQTSQPHGLANGITVFIDNAIEFEYNGVFVIKVTAADQFTYTITGTPSTPATTLTEFTATATIAQVNLISVDFGEAANLNAGEVVSLTTPIVGIDSNGFVQFNGIEGGEDTEDDTNFRDRILDRYQNPVSFFNVAEIEQKTKTVAGVTRVFVQEITPEPGDVTVFFTKDNDPNIIPTTEDRKRVKAALLEIKPANVDPGEPIDPASGGIKVPALAEKKIEFAFQTLVPDTPSLRTAVFNNLDQLFRRDNTIGEPIPALTYECAIFESFDDAGNKVESFQLSTPSGDITVDPDQIATLGDVIFP